MAKKTLPVKVTIPPSIEKAVSTLEGLQHLLRAKGWEKAAIVYAFTTAEEGRPSKKLTNSGQLSIVDFAALGIAGLASRTTVGIYRDLWAESGTNKRLKPGDTVTLPDSEFPPTRPDSVGGRVSKDPAKVVEQIDKLPVETKEAIGIHLVKDPEVKDAIEDEIASDPRAVGRINKKAAAEPKPGKTPKTPKEPDLDGEFQDAAAIIVSRLADKWAGRWNPNDRSLTFEHFLRRVLNDQNDVEATGGVLVEEITAFLEGVAS